MLTKLILFLFVLIYSPSTFLNTLFFFKFIHCSPLFLSFPFALLSLFLPSFGLSLNLFFFFALFSAFHALYYCMFSYRVTCFLLHIKLSCLRYRHFWTRLPVILIANFSEIVRFVYCNKRRTFACDVSLATVLF